MKPLQSKLRLIQLYVYMAISPEPRHFVPPLILVTIIMVMVMVMVMATATASTDIISDLESLRSHSPSGLIRLNRSLLNRILTSRHKSFHLLLFFDALTLNLQSIKSQFALISRSFTINHRNSPSLNSIFFCDIELGESTTPEFLRFGVHTLPDIRILTPDHNNDFTSDSIPLDVGDHSALAESMADFIHYKTAVSIGAIHRPPIVLKSQLVLVIGGFLIFMIRKVIAGETLFHDKKMWVCGTLFVYFFSVSGSMFILIRRIPLFVMDRNDPNNPMFFYKGHGMQFGAEGVCVGFLFTVVGLLLSVVTRVVVRMKDSMVQRATMVGAMIVSFWAVKQVVVLSHWKTGYAVHAYLPSNWYS